jgi:Fic family protein
MSDYPPVPPRPQMPEEFQFLCMLHNVGATSAERSLTVDEISKWTSQEAATIQVHLQRLKELGYVIPVTLEGAAKYHVSAVGIRKVLTLYS